MCPIFCNPRDYRRRQWHPTPILLPGKSHGWRSLVGCSPWGLEESDTTERLHFRFSVSCVGKGNGNPLQCSCQKNPRDGGAWWAAIYGIAQSRTRLKQLSGSRGDCNPPGLQDYRKPHGIPQARILEYSSPGDLLNPGTELTATAWQADSLPLSQPSTSLSLKCLSIERVPYILLCLEN